MNIYCLIAHYNLYMLENIIVKIKYAYCRYNSKFLFIFTIIFILFICNIIRFILFICNIIEYSSLIQSYFTIQAHLFQDKK